MLPPLSQLFAICLPVGGVVGAIVGFAFKAPTDRELIKNVIDGAQLGAIVGTLVALAIWAGGLVGGA